MTRADASARAGHRDGDGQEAPLFIATMDEAADLALVQTGAQFALGSGMRCALDREADQTHNLAGLVTLELRGRRAQQIEVNGTAIDDFADIAVENIQSLGDRTIRAQTRLSATQRTTFPGARKEGGHAIPIAHMVPIPSQVTERMITSM